MSEMKFDFVKVIHDMLYKYECVILPEFGGFIVRESPCNFNPDGKKIKPKARNIFFNPHLTHNDGLLFNEFQNIYQTGYNQATEICTEYIKNLREEIKSNGSADMGVLGTFHNGNNDQFWFAPQSDLNLDRTSFGLPVLDIVKIETEENTVLEENETVKDLTVSEAETLADQHPIETSQKVFKLNYKAWLSAAAIALIAHFAYVNIPFGNKVHDEASFAIEIPDSNKEAQDSFSQTNIVEESVASADTLNSDYIPETTESDNTVESDIPEQTTYTEPEIVQEQVQAEQAPIEELIPENSEEVETVPAVKIAKYKLEVNAIDHQNDLKKDGRDCRIEFNNGWYEIYENNN